ncbi:sigma-70 family RNA polymerase sigma factor [Rufibacter immobilis]|uniref:Sigma-70 family RNA polymerase sigma factor n=1 Tax=Rufibacter immobilis TaxID=1348778 RepID=A0A3M9N2F7_9BACT|nr:sigma-70 family RNA polymerase sigma factor [Rufibacter immobilis]RNI31964.1 sigma-70 family RNA polymerase sigma factor [Rufibacter immobilis]
MPHPPNPSSAQPIFSTEHLFRETYGEVFSLLYRRYGPAHQESIEDALQEAFYAALKVWPTKGLPQKPQAWLLTVAQHKLLNHLKRSNLHQAAAQQYAQENPAVALCEGETQESQLQLLFACCHPKLSESAQIIFALKHLGGFGVEEIAQGVQQSKEAVYKSLQRSRKFFQTLSPDFMELDIQASPDRLQNVLRILYLLFNEGYDTTQGNNLLNRDICLEAVRLTHLLQEKMGQQRLEVRHLLALQYFQLSRFETRLDDQGRFVPLSRQDRSQWDKPLISRGYHFLKEAFPRQLNPYYLQACIAGLHAAAPTYAQTDWCAIKRLYDLLLQQNNSFIIALNSAIAVAECDGVAQGINLLLDLKESAAHYYLYHIALGDLYHRSRQPAQAKACYQTALRLTSSPARQEIIQQKQEQVPTSQPEA